MDSTQSTHCGRFERVTNRREFLAKSSLGFGMLALGDLLAREEGGRSSDSNQAGGWVSPLAPKTPDFPAQAKSVIGIFVAGGPSQVDTFDPKPELTRFNGKALPPSFNPDGLSLQFMKPTDGKLMGSPFEFKRYGESGLPISDIYSNLAQHADRIAVVRSCYHSAFIHGPAITYMSTGSLILGHPSVGSWVTYGLGTESDDLPAYVIMTDSGVAREVYQGGFLPAVYQGMRVRSEGMPIQNLRRPAQIGEKSQRRMLDQLGRWNERHQKSRPGDSRLEARIANFELAYRMQTAATSVVDFMRETKATRELYGLGDKNTERFGKICLMARRMVERGVRYVQLVTTGWDAHGQCAENHATRASKIDKPIAGLISDLAQRGLLDSTLIYSTGEFGRTPVMQGSNGRDHSPYGFSSWLAGGGICGGKAIGATDEFGFRAVEDKVHIHDLHATLLSLLGLDHTKLTFLFEGRERRLTDVGGQNDLAARLTRA